MPLNAKGQKIKAAMEKQYGHEKGDRVFYASENKGNIKGVTKMEDGTHHHHTAGEAHVHHHYAEGANVTHHHYAHPSAKISHVAHPAEGSPPEEAAESPSQEAMEQKATKGLKAAFPENE
jgi:hypothetical protein